MFIPTLIVYVLTIVGIATRCLLYEEYLFVNWTTFGYFYDVGSMIFIITTLVAVNIVPYLGRHLKYVLYLIFCLCFIFLGTLYLNYSYKSYHFFADTVV